MSTTLIEDADGFTLTACSGGRAVGLVYELTSPDSQSLKSVLDELEHVLKRDPRGGGA